MEIKTRHSLSKQASDVVFRKNMCFERQKWINRFEKSVEIALYPDVSYKYFRFTRVPYER